MFIRKSTYDKLKLEHEELITISERALYEIHAAKALASEWKYKYKNLILKRESATNFTEQELKRLLSLIHPDKHQGKQIAVEFTQKVLTLLGK